VQEEIRVEVGAAILDDGEAEIVGNSFEKSGEHNATGDDAEEDKRVNVVGTKDHGKVGAGEGTDATLGDDNFAFFRGGCNGDRSERSREQFLTLERGNVNASFASSGFLPWNVGLQGLCRDRRSRTSLPAAQILQTLVSVDAASHQHTRRQALQAPMDDRIHSRGRLDFASYVRIRPLEH